MNFNSLQYLIFLPLSCAIYYMLPHRVRNPFLLCASYYFYMCWKPEYALLMLLSTAVTYLSGLLMEKAASRKKSVLAGSLFINLSILFFFKYYNFAAGSISAIVGAKLPSLNVLLPVGISFYTFQALGYSIDVYRGNLKAEKNFFDYALFVSFFPQLVAGPIERSSNILPQLKETHRFSFDNIEKGLTPIIWGLFKKVVIADNLAVMVNSAYNAPAEHSGMQLMFATVCFSFQIYCDFSAYSDIARGSAAFFGIELMENFNCPYIAQSIKDFWRRWHISLSSWFKDYIYFPLGGSRKGMTKTCLNLMVVFLISGLWHGAAWTFVLWGFLHGLYQLLGMGWSRIKEKTLYRYIDKNCTALKLLRIVLTFSFVNIAWILFRANSMSDALLILRAVFGCFLQPFAGFGIRALGIDMPGLISLFFALLLMCAVDIAKTKYPVEKKMQETVWLRYAVYLFLLMYIFVFGYYGSGFDPQDFVYFRF